MDDPTNPAEVADHYILDARTVVGDCALWWRPDGSGYTCDLSGAGLYPGNRSGLRMTDVLVPRDVADRLAVKHVSIDRLRRAIVVPPPWADDVAKPSPEDIERRLQESAKYVEPLGDGDCLSAVRVLKNRIVTASKRHQCSGGRSVECKCTGWIEKGERHRVFAQLQRGEMQQYRWCQACTLAMLEGP